MPKVKRIFYHVYCDGCCEELDEEYCLTNTEIKELMRDYGWEKIGKIYYCEKCAKEVEFDLNTVI